MSIEQFDPYVSTLNAEAIKALQHEDGASAISILKRSLGHLSAAIGDAEQKEQINGIISDDQLNLRSVLFANAGIEQMIDPYYASDEIFPFFHELSHWHKIPLRTSSSQGSLCPSIWHSPMT